MEATEEIPAEPCGYCGGSLNDTWKVIHPAPTKYGERRHRKLCGHCSGLKRYASRSVWLQLLPEESELIARVPDEELVSMGAPHIHAISDLNGSWFTLPPGKPWSGHLNTEPLRAALILWDFAQLLPPEPTTFPSDSNRPCRVCGVNRAESWSESRVKGAGPLCGDCDAEELEMGELSGWRRLVSILGELDRNRGVWLLTHPVNTYANVSDADPQGYETRWAFIGESDRDRLRQWVATNYPRLAPDAWVQRWRKAPPPVKKTKRSAVAV